MHKEMSGATHTAGDALQNRSTRLALRFHIFFISLGLLPFIVLALFVFGNFSEIRMIKHATNIYNIVPGLERTFENIIQYRPKSDASLFVVSQFWGFLINSFASIIFAIAWSLSERNHLVSHRVRISYLHQALLFLLPFSFLMVFLYFPVAYVPTAGTSSGKAYTGALLMAAMVSSLWGIFSFIWAAILARAMVQTFYSRREKPSA